MILFSTLIAIKIIFLNFSFIYFYKLIGKNINALGISPDTLIAHKKSFIECFSERKKKNLNYIYLAGGVERNIETIMVPEVSDDSNTVQSILTISRDITALQRMIDQAL